MRDMGKGAAYQLCAAQGGRNPWLASAISFLPVALVLAVTVLVHPRPAVSMPWGAPLGGVFGAGAAVAVR